MTAISGLVCVMTCVREINCWFDHVLSTAVAAVNLSWTETKIYLSDDDANGIVIAQI